MKQTKKRNPGLKMSLRYDKLMIDKEVYTYNDVTGQVELQLASGHEEGGRVSPTSQPNTPHHGRARVRSKSSGRRKKLEKAFSTGEMFPPIVKFGIHLCSNKNMRTRVKA